MKVSSEKSPNKLKLLSECFVKPENIANQSPKEPNYLGGTDLFMLAMDPMQEGLLFDTKLQPGFIENLKTSLNISLVHFYPLAGRLGIQKFDNNGDDEQKTCCFYIDVEAGPGARFIHASVDYTVSDVLLSVDVHPIVESFFELGQKSINYEGHIRPLLSVQVTELVDGFFIGFTMNHCVADGASFWHFVSTLSEIFCQVNGKNKINEWHEVSICGKPIIETLFPKGGYGPTFKLPYLEPDEFINRYKFDPGPLRVRIFHFSPESISKLKAQANQENGPEKPIISSFQALCGFMWRAITRARKLGPEYEITVTISMNARTILDPPLPNEYFRNLICMTHGQTKVSDLTSLGRAGSLVNQCIKTRDGKFYHALVKYFEKNRRVIHRDSGSTHEANVTVGGSPRFDKYGPEFGVGKAVAVLAGYGSRDDGKVMASPGREGGGSVDLEVCLKPESMSALEFDQEFMSVVSLFT